MGLHVSSVFLLFNKFEFSVIFCHSCGSFHLAVSRFSMMLYFYFMTKHMQTGTSHYLFIGNQNSLLKSWCGWPLANICRPPVLEKASRSVWELILDQNGLGKEISDTVERVFCQLSGCEPPLFPTLSSEAQPAKEKEVTPSTSSKKRSFNDMNKEEADGVAQESANGSVMPENITQSSPNSRK